MKVSGGAHDFGTDSGRVQTVLFNSGKGKDGSTSRRRSGAPAEQRVRREC